MVVCILGIALYAIPVGALFEAFGAVLEERAAEEADEQEQRDSELADIAEKRNIGF